MKELRIAQRRMPMEAEEHSLISDHPGPFHEKFPNMECVSAAKSGAEVAPLCHSLIDFDDRMQVIVSKRMVRPRSP